MFWEIKETRKPSIVLMMLSWLHFRYMGRPHHRSSRSVSFKKYVDLITYDREYLVSFLVSCQFCCSLLVDFGCVWVGVLRKCCMS